MEHLFLFRFQSGIGKKTAYELLKDGAIHYMKIGKSFKIPKIYIIEYLIGIY